MAYNGRSMGRGRRRSRRGGDEVLVQTMARVLLFPALLIYLELVFHIHMKTALVYAPVYLFFGIAGGFFLSALTLPWSRTTNCITTKVLAVLVCVIFGAEVVAKTILQSYYGPSALKMAAGNRLTDYSDVIVSAILSKLPILLLLLLPAILLCVSGRRLLGFERLDIRFAGLVLAAALVFHVVGLGVIHLPWKGDLTPSGLYHMSGNGDDQVEQLGLWTMLRLDAKHMIFPAKNTMGNDFSGLDTLNPSGTRSRD